MQVIIAALVGGVVGWLLCRRGHTGVVQVPEKLKDPYPDPDPSVFADAQVIDGVPDNDQTVIVDEANSPGGVDPGTMTFDAEEVIQRDVGGQSMQQGGEALEATSGRDATAPFSSRPSVGSLAAFAGAFPVAPTDPGADPSETPIE